MASRLTTFSPMQMQVPQLQVPMELLYAKLQAAQGSKDEFDQLSALMPQYLQEHSTDASKYKQLVGKVSEDVANAFASGDSGTGMRLLQQGKDFIRKQNQAGGLGYALQSAYDSDAKAKLALDEKFKEDVKQGNNLNYDLAKMMYKVPELGYNPETGVFNSPSAPDVPTYFDYSKELKEYIKMAKPEVKEISKIKGDYIWDEKGSKYHVPDLMNGFFSDPRVQQQIGLSSEYQFRTASPEQRQAMLAQLGEKASATNSQLDSEYTNIKKLLDSKDPKERLLGQSHLKELGLYDGKLDGQVGEKSKQAFEALGEQVKSGKLPNPTENDLRGYYASNIKKGLFNLAEAALPEEYSLTVNQANWRAKLNAENEAKKKMLKEYTDLWRTNGVNAFPTDAPAEAFNAVQKAVEATKVNYDNLKLTLDSDAKKLGFESAEDLVLAKQDPKNLEMFVNNPKLAESVDGFVKAKVSYDNTQAQVKKTTEIYVNGKGAAEYDKFAKDPRMKDAGITRELLLKNPAQAEKAYINSVLAEQFDITVPGFSQMPGWQKAKKQLENSNLVKEFYKKQATNIQEDVKQNFEKYSKTTRQGLRDNSDQYKPIDQNARAGRFDHLPDEQGNYGWSVFNKKTKGYDNPDENVAINRNSIETSIMPDLEGNGITLEMIGEDKEGNVVRRNVHITNPAQDAYLQDWGKKVLADGLNGQESPENMLIATRIVYGVNNANRMVNPDVHGKDGTVINQGFSNGRKKISVLDRLNDSDNTSLITYRDDFGNQMYGVAEETAPNVFVLSSGLEEGKAVYDESEYDKAESVLNTMRAATDGSVKKFHKQRTASDLIPDSEFGASLILNQ